MAARPISTPTEIIPYTFAKSHGVLPVRDEGQAVLVYTRPGAAVEGLAELRRVLAKPLRTESVSEERFYGELAALYNRGIDADTELAQPLAEAIELDQLASGEAPVDDLLAQVAGDERSAPVIRYVNALLLQAVREGASDVHFEPFARQCAVRFRVDGVMRETSRPPPAIFPALVSRAKIM